MASGFGQVAFGRCNVGHAQSEQEPRYGWSNPEDESVNVSIYQDYIRTKIYGFSSRIQPDAIKIEISENGGSSFADAFENGSFTAPYNGAGGYVDDHQANSHMFLVVIQKTSAWAQDANIQVRVTAFDGYGNEATKVDPVWWE